MIFSFCIRYQTIPNYIIMDYSHFLKFIVPFNNYILLLAEKNSEIIYGQKIIMFIFTIF